MTTISDQTGKIYSRLEEQEIDISEDPEDEESADNNDDEDNAAASVFRGTSWDQHEKDHSMVGSKDLLRNSLHRETHNNHSLEHRSNHSFEMDDDDWDEDEASLRRYNLDFKTEIPTNFRPAEFESLPKRLCK